MMLAQLQLLAALLQRPAVLAEIMSRPIAFEGGMLGVHARVELLMEEHRALINLSGLPLGGTIAGEATFDDEHNVVMDEQMDRALRRRLVAVVGVEPHVDFQSLRVRVTLPLLGAKTIKMYRVPNEG
tara:strand:+ start:141 stop:521 length:381 start_codon:yes stop_codon:yes gene_type:complete